MKEHKAVVRGVAYEPLKGRMFSAQRGGKVYVMEGAGTKGGGITGEERVLEPVDSVLDWDQAMVGHPKNYKGDKYEKLYKLLGIPEHVLKPSGSMGTRMMQVALGETHMILGYTKNLKEWDIAAGHVILEALGISVTNIEGNPLKYNQKVPKTHNGILVAHPGIKREILKRLGVSLRSLPL